LIKYTKVRKPENPKNNFFTINTQMPKTITICFLILLVFVASGSFALAQSGTTSSSSFSNPLGSTSSFEALLTNIYNYLTKYVVGPLAVIFIIIGGIMYMLSGGDKDRIERAKKTVIYAIVGLAIVVASSYFYNEIKLIMSGSGTSTTSQLQTILTNVLKLLLSIVGFIAIISMVVGAIWMFTAVGDEEKYELGKKTATYSIIGLMIAVAALIIAKQVVKLIGG